MFNLEYISQVGPFRWLARTVTRQYYKRILRRGHATRLPTGTMFDLPTRSHLASEVYVSGGNIDRGSEALFYACLPDQAVVYDVGSNVGYYAVYLYPKLRKCHAFEPDPRSGALLEAAIRNYPRVTRVAMAVSDRSGHADFYPNEDLECSSLGVRNGAAGAVKIAVITLDEFRDRDGQTVDAVKIDVEGFDFKVLKGARALLMCDQPLVLTEAKMNQEMAAYARELNYQAFAFVRDPRGRKKKFILTQLAEATELDTKMIFLVPPRLGPRFQEFANKQ